jgi:hypothetical protein
MSTQDDQPRESDPRRTDPRETDPREEDLPARDDDTRAEGATGDVPNPETGVGLGAGEQTSFEPEEDPEAAPEDTD